MKHFRSGFVVAGLLLGALAPLTGCAVEPGSEADSELGTVSLPLQVSNGTYTYRLINANFNLTGPESLTLSTGAFPATATELTASVLTGNYTVTLQNGWQLQRIGPSNNTITYNPNQVVMTSQNPIPVSVANQKVSEVTYEFDVTGTGIAFGDGGIRIDIEVCDTPGGCDESSVLCGSETCSDSDVCCSLLDFTTNERALGCGVGTNCTGFDIGPGPAVQITCDQHSDCASSDVCCVVSNNVNSGTVSCRPVCTAAAVGAELGVPPEMLNVGQLCASQVGPLATACPTGQTCQAAVSTLPPEYRVCD